MRIMQLIQSFRNRIASLFIDEAKPARPQPCRAPMMQGLEARTLFSAMAIGMNIERVADYGAAWTFTDAMKESRPWQMFDVNTATYQVTEDTTHPRILDAQGMPTRLDSFTNAQGQRGATAVSLLSRAKIKF